VKVRQLRKHADRADDGERRGDDVIRDAGHEISAARRHFVDRDQQA
jgi:hypothetical protein